MKFYWILWLIIINCVSNYLHWVKFYIVATLWGQAPICCIYKNFVLDDKESPVDWESSILKVIGNAQFTKSVARELNLKIPEVINKDEIIKNICDELDIKFENLLNPLGAEERRKRHDAVNIMIKKYGLTIARVAKIMKISRFTVMRSIE